MREPLRMSGLKEGAKGAVGEKSPRNESHWKEGKTSHRCHKHSLRERKKWPYAGRLFGMKSLEEGAM
jgi:hypothetical protein